MSSFNLRKQSQYTPISNQTSIPDELENLDIMETAPTSMAPAKESIEEKDGLLMQPSSGIDSDIKIKEVPIFENHSQMYEKLQSFRTGDANKDGLNAWNGYFESTIKDTDLGDEFKKNLIEFFNAEKDSEESVDIANNLFDLYSEINPPESSPESVSNLPKESEGLDIAKASTFEIIKIAKEFAYKNKSKKSLFNLQKVAQHKGLSDSVLLSGPSQTSLSPFSRDIQSGLHLIEQNKGFGLKIDDVLDIDFEAIWRGNIMDKYNSPYRDEDGNYVGGYINRRFEVNQNIPSGNNLQLLPGTRGRPWMPEYSTLESRMEVLRGNKDKLQNPSSFSPIVFNLKKKKS